MTTNGASWQPDPTGRHEYRWWDGTAWSDVVADRGVEHHDPVGASQAAAAPGAGYGQAAYPPGGGGQGAGQQAGGGSFPPGGGPAAGGYGVGQQAGSASYGAGGGQVAGGYGVGQQAGASPFSPGAGYASPGTAGSYPPGGGPAAGGYGVGQHAGTGSYGAGGGPGGGPGTGGRGGGGRSAWANVALVGLSLLIVGLVVVLGVVAVNRGDDDGGGGGGDGGDDAETAGSELVADPRTALVTLADLPAGWTESEVTYPPGPNHVCEPRLEPDTPPRASERSFDRANPSGAITHRVVEYTPEFASDYVAEARRQAGECGTFQGESESGGETQQFTGTSELLTGPSFGDETVWYRIQVTYEEPAPSTHAVLVVLDRHEGVISGFTLSTTGDSTSPEDQTMVEELTRLAADRLTGGGDGGGG